MSKALRSPTQAVMVLANMVGGSRLRGLMHLPAAIHDEPTATRVGRVLNGGALRFVPLTPTQGSTRDRVVMIQLSQMLSMEVESPPEEDPPFDVLLPATVTVPPETMYQGHVVASLPAGERRLSDALNRVDRFLRMRVTTRALFVNADHIISVMERDAT